MLFFFIDTEVLVVVMNLKHFSLFPLLKSDLSASDASPL